MLKELEILTALSRLLEAGRSPSVSLKVMSLAEVDGVVATMVLFDVSRLAAHL
jgi:hypothetical protein